MAKAQGAGLVVYKMNNFLSTSDTWNQSEVLKQFEYMQVVIAAVDVEANGDANRSSETINNCIHEIWQQVIHNYSGCVGHRTAWRQMFLVFNERDITEVAAIITNILQSPNCLSTITRCILVKSNGSAEELMLIVDDMLSTSGFLPSFNSDTKYENKILNGILI